MNPEIAVICDKYARDLENLVLIPMIAELRAIESDLLRNTMRGNDDPRAAHMVSDLRQQLKIIHNASFRLESWLAESRKSPLTVEART